MYNLKNYEIKKVPFKNKVDSPCDLKNYEINKVSFPISKERKLKEPKYKIKKVPSPFSRKVEKELMGEVLKDKKFREFLEEMESWRRDSLTSKFILPNTPKVLPRG